MSKLSSLLQRVANAISWRWDVYFNRLIVLFKPEKTLAVYLYYPIHWKFIRSSVHELKRRGYTIHYYIDQGGTVEEFEKVIGEKKLIQKYYMPMVPYRAILTAATDWQLVNRNKKSKMIHMFHSISSAHMIYPHRLFEVYDVLLCSGPHHNEELREMLKLSDKIHYLAETGYEIIDRLMEVPIQIQKTEPPVVLFSPSWGKENSLRKIGVKIIEQLIDHYKVILRPHLISQSQEKDVIESLMNKYHDNDNFVLDQSIDSTPSLTSADVMISDYSGIAFEYALTFKKPVLFLDVPKKINNESWETYGLGYSVEIRYREQLGYIIEDNSKVLPLVDKCVEESDVWNKKIEAILPELLHNPGNCAIKAADQIGDVLKSDFSNFEVIK